MSKLSEKVLKDASSELSSEAANICEGCNTQVDETLKELGIKEGRKRQKKMLCHNCYADYIKQKRRMTINLPLFYHVWLDKWVDSQKSIGKDTDISKTIRSTLDMLMQSKEGKEVKVI